MFKFEMSHIWNLSNLNCPMFKFVHIDVYIKSSGVYIIDEHIYADYHVITVVYIYWTLIINT